MLNASNAGQPGVNVTAAAEGVLFYDGTNYVADEITFRANEFGSFTVYAYAHETGDHTVTITAGGVTQTTTLDAYLQNSINDENLSFSWNFPSQMVMNTTYAITATLTDKWGNPIAAKDTNGTAGGSDFAVSFTGTGSIEINGVGTTVYKDFGTDGTATVFARSIKDIAGPGQVTASLGGDSTYATGNSTNTSTLGTVDTSNLVDDVTTAWDETTWSSALTVEIDVLETAPAAADAKVNAGSFKGYVAVYAKGYEGSRLSAKIGNDWVIVPSLASNFERVVDFTGAGVDIAVRIYIDRVLIDTINLTTK